MNEFRDSTGRLSLVKEYSYRVRQPDGSEANGLAAITFQFLAPAEDHIDGDPVRIQCAPGAAPARTDLHTPEPDRTPRGLRR